ncbi:hypothetical protein [Polymorphospora sp. NPDC050346]|uniref:hypothetical protein n=1 Tax=Polymorphospora sp. NPDC050346 TaxID=3155780 RepID=UPI0033EE08AD
MKTWTVEGREATNRAGAAEHLGLAANTVNMYASPAGRARHGWPEPLAEQVDGQEVFALVDLDAFAAARNTRRTPPATTEAADPDELIGVGEFAELRGVSRDTFKRYVEDSRNAWARGEDGYLPVPDAPDPRSPELGRRVRWQWRRDRAAAWAFPEVRRHGGRKAGPRPRVVDLKAVLRNAGDGERPPVRVLAAELSQRLGVDVSSQVVRRLLSQLKEAEQPQP